ncbi:Hpt domain-containing protein [bacterium]|nr:Hpt domain-containing protein [bacterium]
MGSELNMDQILANFEGNVEMFQIIFDTFLETYQDQVKDIQSAVQAGGGENLRASAHMLKGVLANFNVPEMTDLAYTLEKMGKEGRIDGAEETLSQLEVMIDGFIRYVKEHQTELVSA